MIELRPVTFRAACAFVDAVHRHHAAPRGHKFSIAAAIGDELVGVAMVGRPVARGLDDGVTAEVLRMVTDGTDNVCSLLYGAAARAAEAMGYQRIVTYTLESEIGSSLRASNWDRVAEVRGRSWSCKTRPRDDKHPLDNKVRWERNLRPRKSNVSKVRTDPFTTWLTAA